MLIRKIEKKDNQALGAIVQNVLMEMGAPKVGTAYADPYLFSLYETYNKPKAIYFVLESDGKILGGAGIDQLENCNENICELQKMYFLPAARGQGFATKIMELCLQAAKDFGYEKCYLETMPYMGEAQKLYKKVGFTYLDKPMGDTGHNSCPVWMIKDLK
jgi:putative acetyltransferase